MVESLVDLNNVFSSLGNPIRRDIIKLVSQGELSVGAIAEKYALSLAGIAKHLDVLERARLVRKTRRGKEQIVSLEPQSLAAATEYLELYRELWEERLGSLDAYVESLTPHKNA